MNERILEQALRNADRLLQPPAMISAADLESQVRRRAARRADRRRQALSAVAAIALTALMVVPNRAPKPSNIVNRGGSAGAGEGVLTAPEIQAEIALMVVRNLRAGAVHRRDDRPAENPLDAAVVGVNEAANLLLAQGCRLAETPALRPAAEWRYLLVIESFPQSAAAGEARRLLEARPRSGRSVDLAARF